MATTMAANNGPCHFFRLSAELRNQIYRDVLVEKEQINIDTRGRPGMSTNVFAQPGFLQTCLQIQSEASSIYYGENRFVVRVPNLDVSGLKAFCRRAVACGQSKYHLKVYRCGRGMGWSNMIEWLQAYHAGLVPCCDCDNSTLSIADACVPSKVFELVDELDPDRQMAWDKVERILNVVRDILDVGWTYEGAGLRRYYGI
ncbi:hypothetical protein M409DRAFT_15980 [Zasmidium cellare ATCC 36951]|uniref:Uncharacterized protein n=1 Tax=Zasmidium cellare ATCC 36951 TaxID=1080233 RepID=A0A6A6D7T2_ZASCE|nr:uncharacterized protein M409DRAFT_15980 [Zasmidium cellare ATCC 36951]KAF2173706.1 hypothetical protein M409DRAFT_15980 [Zasmidium cellare ATCC 36951]